MRNKAMVIRDAARRHVGVNADEVGDRAQRGHRLNLPHRIPPHVFTQRRNQRHRAGAEQYRVAIRCGLGHGLDADAAIGAGPVFDDDLLAEHFRQMRRNAARHRIVG
jgi:hypothetical protein